MNPYGYGYGADEGQILGALGAYFACIAFFVVLIAVLYLWLFYRIFKRAGYSGWMTLLNLIPYVGSIIVIFILAFGDWPALKKVAAPSYPPSSGYAPPAAPTYAPPAAPVAPAAPVYAPPAEPAPAPAPAPAPPAPMAPPAPPVAPPAAPQAPADTQPPAPPAPPA